MKAKTAKQRIIAKMYKVCFLWVCPDCMCTISWSYMELAERGSPVCPECDTDMELADKE